MRSLVEITSVDGYTKLFFIIHFRNMYLGIFSVFDFCFGPQNQKQNVVLYQLFRSFQNCWHYKKTPKGAK